MELKALRGTTAPERQLIKALRSGKYTQGHNVMRMEDAHCCLGVGCDISGLGEWVESHDSAGLFHYVEDGCEFDKLLGDTALPGDVQFWFDWATSTGELVDPIEGLNSLAALNDNGYSFPDIADVIEAGMVKLDGDGE